MPSSAPLELMSVLELAATGSRSARLFNGLLFGRSGTEERRAGEARRLNLKAAPAQT
jgi:hypothetical protein